MDYTKLQDFVAKCFQKEILPTSTKWNKIMRCPIEIVLSKNMILNYHRNKTLRTMYANFF